MFEKMLDAMHLTDEYEDDDDELYEDEVEENSFFNKFKKEEEPEDKKTSRQVLNKPVDRDKTLKPAPKITPMRKQEKKGTTMEVCVIKPTSFDDAREISETLLADRTVLLNMKGLDLGIAQRIIDFTCGTCYAIDGNLQRVEDYIFIITPSGVELSGDLAGLVDAYDFSGIQTGF
ncbi:MAG: cell division protein SepF [Clostridia bacterium]|nr:cell division protein SepF [Clostridia bacterium]